jgi:hypothetical protein
MKQLHPSGNLLKKLQPKVGITAGLRCATTECAFIRYFA